MKKVTITDQNAHQRVDKFVRKWLKEAPLSFIYRLFRKKDVKVNGKRVDIDYILQAGDILEIFVHEDKLQDFISHRQFQKKRLPFPIIYEDDHCMIIHKPRGVLVQGEAGEHHQTLTTMVIEDLYAKGSFNPLQPGFVPAPAHRLDRNTSGLILYGKSMEGLQALHQLFKDREDLSKDYLALVVGHTPSHGRIEFPLRKDEKRKMVFVTPLSQGGLTAITDYRLKKIIGDFSLVEIHLHTGRTHQIRVHFQALHHPVAGDRKYGDFTVNERLKKLYGYEDQFLHATTLTFGNLTGVLSGLSGKKFTIDLSDKEKELLLKLERKIT